MRPLGHTDAREGRKDRIKPIDERLQPLWEKYLSSAHHSDANRQCKSSLSRLRPSVAQLHEFILRTPHEDYAVGCKLGRFISHGYQAVPDARIHYDLFAPHLHCLGDGLAGKHLVVDGAVGSHLGKSMSGRLTLRGQALDNVGVGMVGSFDNRGVCGKYAGAHMIGTFVNRGTLGERAGYEMYGRFVNRGVAGEYAGESLLGYNGSWNIPLYLRDQFLRALKNPKHLSRDKLREYLEAMYE